MRCENVHRPECRNEATNAVPMFMGSVWMCPRCSIEHSDPGPSARAPESREAGERSEAIRSGDYVRIPDLDVSGRVKRITRAGELLISYFRDGEFHLAFRTRDRVRAV